ncbi:MAG: hypothetical protein K6V36_09100 [Anaerolineae bacterium]|nr:hypothetical protein [Anaerolineae bacterium]
MTGVTMRVGEVRPQVQVLERGSILFLYQPKPGTATVGGPDDLAQLYFMLIPDDREEHKSRVFGLRSAAMPVIVAGSAAPEERVLAVAEETAPDPRVAIDRLQEEALERAPGARPRPWVRVAGEGRYVLLRHGADTHLAYILDRPEQPGEVQEALRIGRRGNYLISVMPPAAQPDRQPLYPGRLKARLAGQESVPVEPTDYLDYRHTQVLLLAADSDVSDELGVRLEADAQNQGERQALQVLHKEERLAAGEGVALLDPTREGHWA